jgi:hypothetical protein
MKPDYNSYNKEEQIIYSTTLLVKTFIAGTAIVYGLSLIHSCSNEEAKPPEGIEQIISK